MSGDDDIRDDADDVWPLAGEYVLGVLTADERAAVERRRTDEPELAAAIAAWERRFMPLLDEVEPVEPAPGLYREIGRRIGAAPRIAAPSPVEAPRRVVARSETARLRRQVARWRAGALAAALAAAGLAVVIVWRPDLLPLQPPAPQTFVAVFQDGDQAPRFLLSVDLATRRLVVRPVAAEPAADKAYELWIVAEPFGPAPRSLGLLEDVGAPTERALDDIAPAVLRNALFGISLEPAGGSPTGRPTGPALHGTLIPTAPPDDG